MDGANALNGITATVGTVARMLYPFKVKAVMQVKRTMIGTVQSVIVGIEGDFLPLVV
jgi:hypothetical protein